MVNPTFFVVTALSFVMSAMLPNNSILPSKITVPGGWLSLADGLNRHPVVTLVDGTPPSSGNDGNDTAAAGKAKDGEDTAAPKNARNGEDTAAPIGGSDGDDTAPPISGDTAPDEKAETRKNNIRLGGNVQKGIMLTIMVVLCVYGYIAPTNGGHGYRVACENFATMCLSSNIICKLMWTFAIVLFLALMSLLGKTFPNSMGVTMAGILCVHCVAAVAIIYVTFALCNVFHNVCFGGQSAPIIDHPVNRGGSGRARPVHI